MEVYKNLSYAVRMVFIKIYIMRKDYDFVIKIIKNEENKLIHYPALRKLISLWETKWFKPFPDDVYNVYDIYLHSLNASLKRRFR